jgi:hypothetical protein
MKLYIDVSKPEKGDMEYSIHRLHKYQLDYLATALAALSDQYSKEGNDYAFDLSLFKADFQIKYRDQLKKSEYQLKKHKKELKKLI